MTRKSVFVHIGGRGYLDQDLRALLSPIPDLLDTRLVLFEATQSQRLYTPGADKPDAIEALLPLVSDPKSPGRLYLSDQHFLATPNEIITDGVIYGSVGARMRALNEALGDHEVTLILQACSLTQLAFVVRNEIFQNRLRDTGWEKLYEFSWCALISEIRANMPNAQIWLKPNLSVPRKLGEMALRICGVWKIEGLVYDAEVIHPLLSRSGQAELDARGDAELLLHDVNILIMHHRHRRRFHRHNPPFHDLMTRNLFAEAYEKDMRRARTLVDAVFQ